MIAVTKELRKFAKFRAGGTATNELLCIADKIETEIAERYVALPTDADGVPIRVGDDMETLIVGHEGDHSHVEWISLTDSGWDVDGELPTSMRHYHKLTVEDILRKFAEKIIDSQIPNMHPTYEEAIMEYAAKLQLVNDISKEN